VNTNTQKQKRSTRAQAKSLRSPSPSRTMSSFYLAKLAPHASAALPLRAKTFRVIPPASAATPARASNAHSGEDEIAAALAAQTAVAVVPIAAAVQADRDSNGVPAVQADRATIEVTAIPARRAVRNSSRKC
jgi:hypothetical protein